MMKDFSNLQFLLNSITTVTLISDEINSYTRDVFKVLQYEPSTKKSILNSINKLSKDDLILVEDALCKEYKILNKIVKYTPDLNLYAVALENLDNFILPLKADVAKLLN